MSIQQISRRETAPCLCGEGQFVIVHWIAEWRRPDEPALTFDDAPGPDRRGWENLEVACAACQREYSIQLFCRPRSAYPDGPHLQFTRYRDIAARTAAEKAREEAWYADPDVVARQELLLHELQAQRSTAARHRWLRERGLYRAPQTALRREWERDPATVVREIVRDGVRFIDEGYRFLALDAAVARYGAIALPKVESFERPFVRLETEGNL